MASWNSWILVPPSLKNKAQEQKVLNKSVEIYCKLIQTHPWGGVPKWEKKTVSLFI